MTDHDKNNSTAPDRSSPISPEEIAVYRALKPLIAHCLTLNHEINNPLAGILGYAEFILDEGDNLTADQKRQLGQILTCAERIRKSIQVLSERKIALSEDIEMGALIEQYKRAAESSD